MQKAWWEFVKFGVKLAIKLFYRRIEIQGYADYPIEGPILLAPNHQNAFMDALIPTVFARGPVHFLVRADVFKSRLAGWFLRSLNMMPIYRERDGRSNLAKNDAVFEECFKILRAKGTLLIFPEAGHLGVRRLRPLSKGFTRIAFGALESNEDLDLQIVPLGLNYSNYTDSQSRLLINFGTPIAVRDYLELNRENPAKAMATLRSDVQEKLEAEIVHIPRDDVGRAFDIELDRLWPFYLYRAEGFSQPIKEHSFYKKREQSILNIAEDDPYFRKIFIYDVEMGKRRLQAPFFYIARKDPGYWLIQNIFLILCLPLFLLAWIINAPAYFAIRGILHKYVSDKQFYSSIKLAGNLILGPIFFALYVWLAFELTERLLFSLIGVLIFYPLSVFIIRELRLPYRYTLTMWRMLILRWFKPKLYTYLKQIEVYLVSRGTAGAGG